MKYLTLLFIIFLAQGQLIEALPHHKPGTVVLVHGFMGSQTTMSTLERTFRVEGYKVMNWNYDSKDKFIEEHGEDLARRLSYIAKTFPNESISFVTHSMGGLVTRAALNHELCPEQAKIGRAVLIAPPNGGTTYGRKLKKFRKLRTILGDKSGKQLMTTPAGGFDKLGHFPDQLDVLIIAGTASYNPFISGSNDGKVSVKETCLPTPHYHEKSFAGHHWICHTPTVIQTTKDFISSQPIDKRPCDLYH